MINKYIDLLQNHDIKITPNRIIVIKTLAEYKRPLSLFELENCINTIDKSSIFRTLQLFKNKQLVHVLEDGSDSVRYELCLSTNPEKDEDMHVHFYCEKCTKTYCFESISIPHIKIPTNYQVHTINYMIKGLCPKCCF